MKVYVTTIEMPELKQIFNAKNYADASNRFCVMLLQKGIQIRETTLVLSETGFKGPDYVLFLGLEIERLPSSAFNDDKNFIVSIPNPFALNFPAHIIRRTRPEIAAAAFCNRIDFECEGALRHLRLTVREDGESKPVLQIGDAQEFFDDYI